MGSQRVKHDWATNTHTSEKGFNKRGKKKYSKAPHIKEVYNIARKGARIYCDIVGR